MNDEIGQPVLKAVAAVANPKDPLSYPLRQWALMLVMALLGGLASWIVKVRKGETAFYNLMALIGQLTVSAFVGVVVFFGCDYEGLPVGLTAGIVGMAGHMGTRAIALLEAALERRAKQVLGEEK